MLRLIIAGGGRPISAPGALELKSDLRGPRLAMGGLVSPRRMIEVGPIR